jgi:hypothetical protein
MGATEKSKLVAQLVEDYSINYTSKDGILPEYITTSTSIFKKIHPNTTPPRVLQTLIR